MAELTTSYFRDLLSKNVICLQNLCKEWQDIYEDSSVPDEVKDEIRTNIGLTNLLMAQKLKQFEGLIEDSELGRGEKEITCLDLQGFWDMVHNEVEKVIGSFQKLSKCKENNWSLTQSQDQKPEIKKKTIPMIAKTSVSTKKHASAARQRLAEAKKRMKEQMALKDNGTSEEKNKVSISNVTNTLDKQTESSNKQKSLVIGGQEKENLYSSHPSECQVSVKKRAKNSIPLQCVTRSAKRAMMAK